MDTQLPRYRIGLVDMDWVTNRWEEMALELLVGKTPASRPMRRATVDRRGSIILQSIPTKNAGKDEVESTTLNAEYSALIPASAALTLGTSKLKMLQHENAHQPRKWRGDESDFMNVRLRPGGGKKLSSNGKNVFAPCVFWWCYGKIPFARRR